MQNGIPFDLAFQLDDTTRTAWAIVFADFTRPERYRFDWQSFTFPDPPE